jgi:hypothetical protein
MDGVEAGRLIAFALDRGVVPGKSGQGAEYAGLIKRYNADVPFHRLVDDILEGAGCEVAYAGPEGVVIRSDPDGPWAFPAGAEDLPWNRKKFKSNAAAERAARMTVVPALLAYIAPSSADFDDLLQDHSKLPPAVSVRDLELFIREFALQLESGHGESLGEERPMWWHWVQSSSDIPTPKRVSPNAMLFLVNDVLSFLHGEGLLVKTSGTNAGTMVYRPRRRILYHYRDLLVDDLFASLQEFAEHRPAPQPDAPTTTTAHEG